MNPVPPQAIAFLKKQSSGSSIGGHRASPADSLEILDGEEGREEKEREQKEEHGLEGKNVEETHTPESTDNPPYPQPPAPPDPPAFFFSPLFPLHPPRLLLSGLLLMAIGFLMLAFASPANLFRESLVWLGVVVLASGIGEAN